jgi:hypothetical protein
MSVLLAHAIITIYTVEPFSWKEIEVPKNVVEYCADFTKLDPVSPKNSYEDLVLLDCYWYKMGYYDDHGRLKIEPIPVIPVFE